MTDSAEFGRAIAERVKMMVQPIQARLADLESREPAKGEKGDPGPQGEPGAPGADAPPVEIEPADIVRAILTMPELIDEAVQNHLKECPAFDPEAFAAAMNELAESDG